MPGPLRLGLDLCKAVDSRQLPENRPGKINLPTSSLGNLWGRPVVRRRFLHNAVDSVHVSDSIQPLLLTRS